MKKQFLSCLIGLTMTIYSLIPIPVLQCFSPCSPIKKYLQPPKCASITASMHMIDDSVKRNAMPIKTSSSVQMSYINLTEQEKWILDEVLSDNVSEHVVEWMESGMDYVIGDWVEQEIYTCLFLEKRLPEGTLYTVCGYAKTDNGYVYFELSSSKALTKQQVHQEVERNFSGKQSFQYSIC